MTIARFDNECVNFILKEISKTKDSYKVRFIRQKLVFKNGKTDITPTFIIRQRFGADWEYLKQYRFKVNDYYMYGFAIRARIINFSQYHSFLSSVLKSLKKLIVLSFLKFQAQKLVKQHEGEILSLFDDGFVCEQSFKLLKPLNKLSKDEVVENLHYQIGRKTYTKNKSDLGFYFDLSSKKHKKSFKLFEKLIYRQINELYEVNNLV